MEKNQKEFKKNRSRFPKSHHELKGMELTKHLESVSSTHQSAAGSAILIRAMMDLVRIHSASPADIATQLLAISGEDAMAGFSATLEEISSEVRKLACIS